MNKLPCTYMMASGKNGTLYVGVTSDIEQRVNQHKAKEIDGFTKDYDVTQLVWYDFFDSMEQAIAREKALKNWHRKWKIRLIEELNPGWIDLMG